LDATLAGVHEPTASGTVRWMKSARPTASLETTPLRYTRLRNAGEPDEPV
jgi:hypothetical protein